MQDKGDFDLKDFLPYLLNLAAEEASDGFQTLYKDRYGMLRTEWRVLFHLGRYGDMTAKEICDRARMHKTKISRAVTKLEQRRFVSRKEVEADRRHAMLSVTEQGRAAYADLCEFARHYDGQLVKEFTAKEEAILRRCLSRLAVIKG
ncbi:MAG: MarR family winged helix-turn-helix transcriptional regulator [Paracoccaceae bacterium]